MADFVDLSGSDLRAAVLDDIIFGHVNLQWAKLAGCSLRRCLLQGVDLSEARGLEEATLDGTRYDPSTMFPDGYRLPGTLVVHDPRYPR